MQEGPQVEKCPIAICSHQGYLAIYMKMARVKKIERQKMFDFIIHVAT